MARASKIDRLPAEFRETIGALRRDGFTIDEIHAHLRKLGVEDVSRSGLGRHVKSLDQIAERLQHARAVAEAMVDRFGDAPEHKVGRLNIELAHSMIMQLMAGEDGETVTLDAEQAMFVATAIQRLSAASKQDVERETKLRQAIAKELGEKAKRAIDKVEGELGIGGAPDLAAALKRIREEVYGIVPSGPGAA